jgi:hypothetical protein
MDPITAAIVAALTSLAEPAVKDAYQGLKSVIVRKLGTTHEVVKAVENLEQKPDSTGRRDTLQEEIAAARTVDDTDIAAAARALLEDLKKRPGGSQTVQQTVTGNKNVFSGTGDVHIGGTTP